MTVVFPPPCAARPEASPEAPAPRLLARTPSRALAEAMGAASTCRHGPCAALRPLWPDLARAVGLDGSSAAVRAHAAEALRTATTCHQDCPAAAALRDVSALTVQGAAPARTAA